MADNPILSIITCHPSSDEVPTLRHSVEANMGLGDTEIVVSIAPSSIASAYNHGAHRAVGHFLLFTHSDVELLTSRSVLAAALRTANDPKIGVVGIAGTRVLNQNSIWWSIGDQLSGACMHTDGQSHWMTAFGRYGRVVVLDGVVLLMRREVFDKVGGFDETFPFFDYYDIDLTLRVHLAGLMNATYPLHVLHHSLGDTRNKPQWDLNRRQFTEKWKAVLPVYL